MTGERIVFEGREVTEVFTELLTKPFLSLGVIFLFALIQTVRFGIARDNLILAAGSCLSGVLIFGYGLLVFGNHEKRSWRLTFLTLAGFIPFAFGCYLVFYKGFWGFRDVFAGFSVGRLLARMMFIVLGYQVVNGFYLVTEFVKKVTTKEVVLK